MNSIFKTFVLSALMVAQVHFAYAQNAAILPPAKTTFVDQNGKPLTSGTVDFYIPGTTTRKTTWQDSAATIANTNPVTLDSAGRGLILGNGAYRQIVKDRLGNQVWDQVTNSSGAGGSGSVTVGDGNAVGTVLPYSGLVAPSNYAFPYGQELSRTTYSQLLSAITLTQNVTCISGNSTLTTISDTTQLNVGGAVEAACVPAGSTILSKTASTVTISANATVGVTTTATFFPWGGGNGLTTFNAPDLRGVVLPGRNNMGGSNSVNLSNPTYTDPNAIAGAGGSQSKTLLSTNLPSYTPAGTITNGAITFPNGLNTSTANGSQGAMTTGPVGAAGVFTTLLNAQQATTTFAGTSVNGGIAVSATVSAGGSGYSAGTQLLTVTGGTCTTQPQFNITGVAGAITAPVLVTAGQCSVTPANPAATSGGGGTAGTLTITYSAVPFSVIQPSKTINYIVKVLPDVNLSIARCANLIDAGTACTANVGTSGGTIPLNNTANSFSAAQIFSAGVAISGGATTITALSTPTNPTDAATKAYVDSVATGLNILSQSRLASAAVLPNTPTYANGALGVGATLTAGSNTTLTVDGTLAALNDIILVKNQASAFQNGVYTLTQVGSGAAPWILTRATYFDQAAEMKAGSYTLVTAGSTNIGTSWALQTAITTVGTDALNWIQFSATAGVTSVGGFNGIVTNAQVTSSCNIFTGALSGCVPSTSGTTAISYLDPVTKAWATPTSLTIQTRTAAAALNLTNVNVVQTLGYSSAGDGGGATFKLVGGGTPFLDSFISSGTITTNGTGSCTNGTLLGQVPNSPNTQGYQSTFTITVAGNVVTGIAFTAPGNGYAAGTVLTFTVPGCSGSVTWTINAVTTPSGSFTDAGGNKWQIVFPGDGLDARAMGVKFDWTVAGGDAGATDNFTNLQNAINFAAYSPGFIDTGSSNGSRVLLTRGTALICGATGATPLKVWQGVALWGQSSTASVIKVCDTWVNTTNFVELCDSASHVACFSSSLNHMQLFALYSLGAAAGLSALSAVYTNSCQHQGCGLYDVVVYPGACRRGITAETGYGGAAMVEIVNSVEIKGGQKSANCGGAPGVAMFVNYGTTQVVINHLNLGGLSATSGFGPRDTGLAISGGIVTVNQIYAENVIAPVLVNIPTALTNGIVKINGFDGGTACVNGVLRAGGSIANSVKLEMALPNSCTNTYNNAGAASGAVAVVADIVF